MSELIGGVARYYQQKPYNLFGLVLLSLYLIMVITSGPLSPLSELYQIDLYKQLSGFLLLSFVIWQWRLAYLRVKGRHAKAARNLFSHKWLGVIAPVILLLHTTQVGYAYQTLLFAIFVVTIVTGLFSFHEIRMRKQWMIMSWTVLHITMALSLPMLILYHVYVTYTFW